MAPKKEISKEILDYISKLALLELSEEEQEDFINQLENILNYFKKLEDLNTENIEPTRHPIEGLKNVFRDDIPWKSLSKRDALKNAKYTKDGYFKAPKVIKDKN